MKNAAGHITRYENYDVFGNATRVIDPNGVAVERTFDPLGRLVTSTTKGVVGCNTADDPLSYAKHFACNRAVAVCVLSGLISSAGCSRTNKPRTTGPSKANTQIE